MMANGHVKSTVSTPRSFYVHTEGGSELRRNCRHLKKSTEVIPQSSDDSEDLGTVHEDISGQDSNLQPTAPVREPVPGSVYQTASGRSVRPPARYRDYV